MTTQIIRSGDGTLIRVSQKDRRVEFRLSDDSLDRANSRIDPRGIETANYQKNPIFLWGHDGYGSPFRGPPKMEHVIGRTVTWGVTRLNRAVDAEKDRGYAFDITVEFAPAEVNPEADRAFRLVKEEGEQRITLKSGNRQHR